MKSILSPTRQDSFILRKVEDTHKESITMLLCVQQILVYEMNIQMSKTINLTKALKATARCREIGRISAEKY
jgi:phage terminase large subunit